MTPVHESALQARQKTRGQRGIAIIEAFLFVSIFGVALLWHAASNLSGYRLMRAEASHGNALQTMRHFAERLRADSDWQTLYDRLVTHEATAPAQGHPPNVYYADFETPAELGTVGVVVEVPQAVAVGAVVGTPLILREDITAARFGLPYDLNGDGVVDADARDTDYRALPIILSFNWTAPGDAPQSLKLFTWLRGAR